MNIKQKWSVAQRTEATFWDGVAHSEADLLRVLADNATRASLLRGMLRCSPRTCLEVGVGPLGVGITGFFPEIPFRVGVDPLQRVEPECGEPLQALVRARRSGIRYVVSRGEQLPFADRSMDLVVCSNVLDHTSDPEATLREISRVLKAEAFLFLDVDTFSVAGLVKWHTFTKHIRREEVLVKAHPYRFFEWALYPKLKASGFEIVERQGHSLLSLCLGSARESAFLVVKRENGDRFR